MNLLLVRHAYLPDVTLGTLQVGSLTFATLEDRWSKNPLGPGGQPRAPGKFASCVEDGGYELQPHDTPSHPACWALHNPALGVWHLAVPPDSPYGRAAILIHSGNSTADTEGCVLVGLRHAHDVDGSALVLQSRAAMEQLRALLGTTFHTLDIRPTAGTSEVNA